MCITPSHPPTAGSVAYRRALHSMGLSEFFTV